jgi:hypothetical protein
MCFANHDLKKFYINIPKNATNWGKSAMKDLDWVRSNYHQDKLIKQGYEAIVILRNPIDRWFSGFAEYTSRYNIKLRPDQLNELALRLITDRVAFDEHTEEQSMFLDGINSDTTTWFKFGPELNLNFADYCRNVLGIENNLEGKDPKYSATGTKAKVRGALESVFTEDHYKRLDKFYELDIDLYNNVKYYKRNKI